MVEVDRDEVVESDINAKKKHMSNKEYCNAMMELKDHFRFDLQPDVLVNRSKPEVFHLPK